jgi:hypothetical protein
MASKDLEYEHRRPRDRGLRASDRDREAVSAILGREHVVGRITTDEFQERLDRCLHAKTYGELDALIADLPHDEPASPSRWSFRPAAFMLVPVALIAAIAVSGGRIGFLAIPFFFFVVRPLVWHSRGRRAGWGPPSLPPRSNQARPFS